MLLLSTQQIRWHSNFEFQIFFPVFGFSVRYWIVGGIIVGIIQNGSSFSSITGFFFYSTIDLWTNKLLLVEFWMPMHCSFSVDSLIFDPHFKQF